MPEATREKAGDEMATKREEFLSTLQSWNGAVMGDAKHKEIVDAYNSYLPHPRGYKLTAKNNYCAATVSAAAILCGLTDVIPIECSCSEQIKAYQKMGRWIEADDHVPEIGEQVFYDWQDGTDFAKTDNTGAPDHTGIVTAVSGKTFTVFEGNKGSDHACGYREMTVNGRYIRGFGSPAYPANQTVLTRGDKGAAVAALQEFLKACGYTLDVDESFGPATQAAWNAYVTAYLDKALNG